MTILQGILLGITQGLTEFLPVSSSGHLIIVRNLLGIHEASALFFDAVLHLATLLAVIVCFRKDIWSLITTVVKYALRQPLTDEERAFCLAVIFGTIPAIVLGLLFEDKIASSFRGTTIVAWGLLIGSFIMYLAEKYYRDRDTSITARTGWRLGWFQALALFPGISRSGATIAGGLFSGFSRNNATRFAFVLSFPILLGAGTISALRLFTSSSSLALSTPLIAAFLSALISGFLAIHFLLRFLRTHTLRGFIWYRVILAVLLFFFPF